jgi:hypothetical protein
VRLRQSRTQGIKPKAWNKMTLEIVTSLIRYQLKVICLTQIGDPMLLLNYYLCYAVTKEIYMFCWYPAVRATKPFEPHVIHEICQSI